ncbi:GNAT family N-acetyltransferase [Sphingomonas daechungensis]|uniref:GNAT family N-acetyltransferase n=1 Tax=Sphingomonas daechungensis TaxID=1176646 RepID=UPI0031E6439D
MSQAPVLETERLRLRPWRKEDFHPYHALLQHPEVHRHFGPQPMGAEECWRRLTSAVGGWDLNGFGTWAVERKGDGRLVGNAGIFTAWRDLEPEFGEEPEMGWIFAAETHGQGMASEACRAVLGWTEANLAPTPIWAIIAPANEPSLKLAAKLGFERVQETAYHDDPTVVLKRPAW